MRAIDDPKCVSCGQLLPWTSTRRSCGKPECDRFAAELSRAMWEGHLLRRNVEPKAAT
jgi:hypothetical protein